MCEINICTFVKILHSKAIGIITLEDDQTKNDSKPIRSRRHRNWNPKRRRSNAANRSCVYRDTRQWKETWWRTNERTFAKKHYRFIFWSNKRRRQTRGDKTISLENRTLVRVSEIQREVRRTLNVTVQWKSNNTRTDIIFDDPSATAKVVGKESVNFSDNPKPTQEWCETNVLTNRVLINVKLARRVYFV